MRVFPRAESSIHPRGFTNAQSASAPAPGPGALCDSDAGWDRRARRATAACADGVTGALVIASVFANLTAAGVLRALRMSQRGHGRRVRIRRRRERRVQAGLEGGRAGNVTTGALSALWVEVFDAAASTDAPRPATRTPGYARSARPVRDLAVQAIPGGPRAGAPSSPARALRSARKHHRVCSRCPRVERSRAGARAAASPEGTSARRERLLAVNTLGSAATSIRAST